MSVRPVTFETEEIYHLYNRGVNRGNIFFDESNYYFFINRVKHYLLPVMDIIAYCLMPTHYHLLIRVTSEFNDNNGKNRIVVLWQGQCKNYLFRIQKLSINVMTGSALFFREHIKQNT